MSASADLVSPSRVVRQAASRRRTTILCLVLLLGLLAGLQRWTHGFEVWTFDGRRQMQWQAGELQAPQLLLRGTDGGVLRLWGDAGIGPRAYLVDFIYTRCPGVCRALGSEYQQMQQALAAPPGAAPAEEGVRLVSISFDVEHDTPARLAQYAAELRADPRRWAFAVPATSAAADVLLRSLGVVVIPDGDGGFVHNGAIHLLDERGRLRGLYEVDQWPQALLAAHRLAETRREAPR